MSWVKKYTIDQISLGSGEYGEVKLAIKKENNEQVCVKLISKKKEFGINILRTNQISEFDIAKQMINFFHPNLVNVIDVYDEETDEFAYIFMELCENNLGYYISQQKVINYEEINSLIVDITNGYLALKEKCIIHRDFKPANILYKIQNGKFIFKIGDFGLSKIIDNNQEMTYGVGTPFYRAPEVLTFHYDDRCDIFSFGIIIFEMLTGKSGSNSLFRFKEKQKLEQNQFSQLYQSELKNIKILYRELLDQMIVYNVERRISWDQLSEWIKNKGLFCIQQMNQFPNFQQTLNNISLFQQQKIKNDQIQSFSNANNVNAINKNIKEEPQAVYFIPQKIQNKIQVQQIFQQPQQIMQNQPKQQYQKFGSSFSEDQNLKQQQFKIPQNQAFIQIYSLNNGTSYIQQQQVNNYKQNQSNKKQ